jgi:gamma-glutamyl phosphate reductase
VPGLGQCGSAARRHEAVHSNRAIMAAFQQGLAKAGVPAEAVQLIPTQDRAAVGAMLTAQGLIDMIVPRGGKSLVERVQNDARVPVLAHLDGICHTYLHAGADVAMARSIVLNAKLRRTGICGSMETLLIDAAFPAAQAVVANLLDAGCEIAVMRAPARSIRASCPPAMRIGIPNISTPFSRWRLSMVWMRRWRISMRIPAATPMPSSPATMPWPRSSSPASTAPS